mmetsp:Transcript_3924/g.10638  ORF Transcript_3924/g.10638 Transcript_3924/m.10638 type:complete len:83 (+) Transcript_3924:925-1173(+)
MRSSSSSGSARTAHPQGTTHSSSYTQGKQACPNYKGAPPSSGNRKEGVSVRQVPALKHGACRRHRTNSHRKLVQRKHCRRHK